MISLFSKKFAFLFLAVFLAATPVSFSQERVAPARNNYSKEPAAPLTHHLVGFNFGHTVLFGEWGDLYDDSISYNFLYGYEASQVFSFLINVGFSNHSGQGENSLSVKNIEPDLKVNFLYFDMLSVYGFGGFGIYPVSQSVGIANGSTLNFGVNLGLGLDLRIEDRLVFGPGIAIRSIFSKVDKSAKSSEYPGGMNIGGEMLRLYMQIGVLF